MVNQFPVFARAGWLKISLDRCFCRLMLSENTPRHYFRDLGNVAVAHTVRICPDFEEEDNLISNAYTQRAVY